jgi:hypothetical protein
LLLVAVPFLGWWVVVIVLSPLSYKGWVFVLAGVSWFVRLLTTSSQIYSFLFASCFVSTIVCFVSLRLFVIAFVFTFCVFVYSEIGVILDMFHCGWF